MEEYLWVWIFSRYLNPIDTFDEPIDMINNLQKHRALINEMGIADTALSDSIRHHTQRCSHWWLLKIGRNYSRFLMRWLKRGIVYSTIHVFFYKLFIEGAIRNTCWRKLFGHFKIMDCQGIVHIDKNIKLVGIWESEFSIINITPSNSSELKVWILQSNVSNDLNLASGFQCLILDPARSKDASPLFLIV